LPRWPRSRRRRTTPIGPWKAGPRCREGRQWGSTSAVDIDKDGKSVWVAERCGANSCVGSDLPAVLKFDETGKLVKSFGAGMFAFPHGIHVDREGNVWVPNGSARAKEPPAERPTSW
jgi:hypothetical protein